MIENVINSLKVQFSNKVRVELKRPNIYQLFLPFYYEDGDMMEIYLQEENGLWKICDYAMTLMRLSYQYEIDTANKEKVFQKIILENNLQEEDGNIFLFTKEEEIYPSLMQFVTGISKVSSMKYFKREIIASLFYEELNNYILNELKNYKPVKEVFPLKEREDLEVDYALYPNGHPVYLFGVKDNAKARLVTISCLEFLRANLKFRSFVVYENFEEVSKKDRTRLTNACDKQFTSLKDFQENALIFLEREKAF